MKEQNKSEIYKYYSKICPLINEAIFNSEKSELFASLALSVCISSATFAKSEDKNIEVLMAEFMSYLDLTLSHVEKAAQEFNKN